MTIEAIYQIFLKHPSVQTDTRKLAAGDIFFALKGPSFNGNQFAKQALETGAAYAVIEEKEYYIDDRTILVKDVLKTLQDLAGYHRAKLNIPVIAITGSNGKTTTKELVHAVLSSTFRTYTTEGNLNNHIGIPLTLLKIQADAEIAVVEMGANHQKEIEGYCSYTKPTYGIITNCGKAHLEGFGGVEGVRKGKGELYDFLRTSGGTAFVMWDYDYLQSMSNGIKKIITYGTMDADVNGSAIKSDPFLEASIHTKEESYIIKSQLVGDYNLPNLLVAVTVGRYFKIESAKIKSAIENYIPSNSRSQLVEQDGNKIVLDAYNANPSSMKLAIENFSKGTTTEKILMLGAMAELGDESLEEHKSIIDLIDTFKWKAVVLVGGDFLKIPHSYISLPDSSSARQWYLDQQLHNCQLLVKGSRSMKMEKVLGR